MPLPILVSSSLAFASQFKYLLLFIGTIVEGPILMVASGFFLHTGVFSLVPLFLTFVAGDLVGDVGWYCVGRYFAEPILRRHGRFLNVTPERFERMKILFNRHHEKILLISKITLGFGMALVTLIVAGATRVPFRVYMFLNLLGELILVAVLLFIGYFFGGLYGYIAEGFRLAFITGALALVVAILYGFSKYLRNKTLQI